MRRELPLGAGTDIRPRRSAARVWRPLAPSPTSVMEESAPRICLYRARPRHESTWLTGATNFVRQRHDRANTSKSPAQCADSAKLFTFEGMTMETTVAGNFARTT